MTLLRVLVVDDDEELRSMYEVALELEPDMQVVGLAADAEAALAAAGATVPDVVVLDNHMPGRPGIDIVPELLSAGVGSVILHTAHPTEILEARVLLLGATLVPKGGPIQELLEAVRATVP